MATEQLHRAEQILRQFDTLLLQSDEVDATISRVRAFNYEQEDLPAITIFMQGETLHDDNPPYNDRMLTVGLRLYVEAHVNDPGRTDAALNSLTRAVAIALRTDELRDDLGLGFVIRARSEERSEPEIQLGEREVAMQDLTYIVHYRHDWNDPATGPAG